MRVDESSQSDSITRLERADNDVWSRCSIASGISIASHMRIEPSDDLVNDDNQMSDSNDSASVGESRPNETS